MDRTRWVYFAAILVMAFVASVAVGAWVGRQWSGSPVAAVATPTPAPTAPASPTAVLPTPLPTDPTSPPTPSPSPPPAVTPEPTPALDPATAEEFAADLLAAFQAGDTAYLADRLHAVVFERYGEEQCRTLVATFTADPSSNWTVASSSGPAAWSWETDDLATAISDAWTVTVNETGGPRDLHFAPSEGEWRWFLDCGTPR